LEIEEAENRDRNQSRRDQTVGIVKELNQCRILRALPFRF